MTSKQSEQLMRGRKTIPSKLLVNQSVYTRIRTSDAWERAIVERIRDEPDSYDLLMTHGRTLRRARHQIRHIPQHITNTIVPNYHTPTLQIPVSNTINYTTIPNDISTTTNQHPPLTPIYTNNNYSSTETLAPLRRSQRIRRPPDRYVA